MKYLFRLSLVLFINPVFGQFNTLTYSIPLKVEDLKPSTIIIEPKKVEKKETKTRKKKLFTTKADLKKELDSLKFLVIDLGKKEKLNIKKIEDSLIQNLHNKLIIDSHQTSYKSIKKYDFIIEHSIKKIAMPLDKMIVTSPFGFRTHPILGGRKMHNGIDLGANYENVYAVLDGIVSEAGWDNNGGGNYIKVKHSNRFETSYLHLSEIYYQVGEPVKAGYIIGKSWNSGNSTGPHLHFAVKEFGVFVLRVVYVDSRKIFANDFLNFVFLVYIVLLSYNTP